MWMCVYIAWSLIFFFCCGSRYMLHSAYFMIFIMAHEKTGSCEKQKNKKEKQGDRWSYDTYIKLIMNHFTRVLFLSFQFECAIFFSSFKTIPFCSLRHKAAREQNKKKFVANSMFKLNEKKEHSKNEVSMEYDT